MDKATHWVRCMHNCTNHMSFPVQYVIPGSDDKVELLDERRLFEVLRAAHFDFWGTVHQAYLRGNGFAAAIDAAAGYHQILSQFIFTVLLAWSDSDDT